MDIRTATSGDFSAICDLWNPVIRQTLATFTTQEQTAARLAEMLAERLGAGHAFLVAELDGTIAGFGTYRQFRAGVGYAKTMEHTVVVDPAAHGRGVGRELVAALEDHARQGGAHSIFAGVSAANPDGVAFHAALGYLEVARLKDVGHKFERALDLVLMQKIL